MSKLTVRFIVAPGLFVIGCFSQAPGETVCRDAEKIALELDSAGPEARRDVRHCAGIGYTRLAEDSFNRGSLPEASRYAGAAVRLLEAESLKPELLISALRLQGAIFVERGMLGEAGALLERLKTMPVESPAQNATIQGLAAACHQASGDPRAAERDYLRAIALWDGMQKSQDSVSERSNLGVLYLASRRFDEAVAVLERANALLAGSRTGASYLRLVVANNLAVAYSERGDTALAVRHAHAAIRLADAAGAGRHQLTASVYTNGAAIFRMAGRKKDATQLEDQARRAEAMANAVVDLSDFGRRKQRQ